MGRKPMTDAQKEKKRELMKAYWAERKAKQSGQEAKPPTKNAPETKQYTEDSLNAIAKIRDDFNGLRQKYPGIHEVWEAYDLLGETLGKLQQAYNLIPKR